MRSRVICLSLFTLLFFLICSTVSLAETPRIINYNASWGYDAANRSNQSIDTVEIYYGFNASGSLATNDLFNASGLLKIYQANNVLPNYIVARNGSIIQTTADKNIAGHAGTSRMPAPDNRTHVNLFSLGIRVVCLNGTVAKKVANITWSDPRIYGPTDEQYKAVASLIAFKNTEYPLRNFVFYNEIKIPGLFPGSNIDKEKLQVALRDQGLALNGYNLTRIK
jgi:hypothetical protein